MKNKTNTPLEDALSFFTNAGKAEFGNFLALKAIFQSHELETKEFEEAFITYAKQVNSLKVTVLKQLEQTALVDDTLAKLNFKVKDHA